MAATKTRLINQKKYESDRQKVSLQNMYFNRYLLIRYTSALFIFINLYGCLLLGFSGSVGIILPTMLLGHGFIVMWEQMKLFSTPKNSAIKTKYFFRLQLICSILMLAIIFTPFYSIFFNFLKGSIQIKIVIAFLAIILALISTAMLYKLKKIENLEDRQYHRIIAYQKSLNL